MIIEVFGNISQHEEIQPSDLINLKSLYSFTLTNKIINEGKLYLELLYQTQEDIASNVLNNNEHFLVIIGYIEKRNDFKIYNSVTIIDDVYGCYLNGKKIGDYFKGDFNILIWSKTIEKFEIISDHFNFSPILFSLKNKDLLFSSNLKVLKNIGNFFGILNNKNISEFLLFNVFFDDHTFYKNIKSMRKSEILLYEKGKITRTNYWEPENLIINSEVLYNIDDLIQTFRTNLNAINKNHIQLPLTGGYDSRTILSFLLKDKYKVNAFSYGVKGNPDIQIPLEIVNNVDIKYNPIYLDTTDFQNFVNENGQVVSDKTNGLGTYLSANNLYALSKLNNSNSTYLSGILGSEIFKPIIRANEIYLYLYKNTVLNEKFTFEDFKQQCKQIISNSPTDLGENDLHYLYEYILGINRFNYSENKALNLFSFLLFEVYRNYFMKEINLIKKYLFINLPYIDVDFLERTFLSEIYLNMEKKFNSSLSNKKHAFYIRSIKVNAPELLKIRTNLGIIPLFESSNFLLPISILSRIKRKIQKGSKSNKIFNYEQMLSKLMVQNHVTEEKPNNATTKYAIRLYSVNNFLNVD